jgi:hypothetical protein
MNAPPQNIGGVRNTLCHQEMIEQLGLVAVYASIAQQMPEIGDEPGSDYAMRRAGAHMRAAIVARNHLKENDAEAP